jgi:hypothetical protein
MATVVAATMAAMAKVVVSSDNNMVIKVAHSVRK